MSMYCLTLFLQPVSPLKKLRPNNSLERPGVSIVLVLECELSIPDSSIFFSPQARPSATKRGSVRVEGWGLLSARGVRGAWA